MADQAVEGDGYPDEDLDALPVNTFQKLQEDAFKSTQRSKRGAPQVLSRAQQHVSTDLGGGFLGLSSALEVAAPQRRPLQPSSDYGDFDGEILDGEIFNGAEPSNATHPARSAVPLGENTQREEWRQQRCGHHSQSAAYHVQQPYPPGNTKIHSLRTNMLDGSNPVAPMQVQPLAEQTTAPASADVESLQFQVQRLLHEREVLKQEVLNANDDSIVKAGEIAMVRARISKVEQEFETRTKVQQSLHVDESVRYKAEIAKARSEIQNITTEKAFLENELAEGSKQLRQAQKAMKKGPSVSSETKEPSKEKLPVTPRKSKNFTYADGFNDDEVQILSPSKLALRGKTSTPRAGVKRKRKFADDSPIQAQQLELVEPIRQIYEGKVQQEIQSIAVVGNQNQRQQDADLHFSQRLLNHKPERSQERTIEALSRFRLPSRPEKPLSTLLYDQILTLGGGAKLENLPAAVGLIVISLWSQCLKEHYHLPVHLLIDLVEFIILVTPLRTAPELTNSLMGLVQETADIVVIPRCQKRSPGHESCQITSLACLRVIQIVAQDCSTDVEEISRFWRTMRFDFTMMLLSFLHPLEEIHIAVAILRTSVLKNSFAMIIPPGDGKQDVSEAHVIDNLSRLLVESPRPSQGEPTLDAVQLCELRIEILGLLDSMCERQYCAEALAKHRLVIGRLVRVMNDELDKAYSYLYGHSQRIALVNAATHLLYVLISNYAPLIDLQARLSVIPGGEKKFLIVLTRLAFNEGGFLDGDVKDEVVDQAHQLLEMRVSPEEADQLVGTFASAQSNRRVSKGPILGNEPVVSIPRISPTS